MGIKINYETTPIHFYRFFYLCGPSDYNYVGSTTNMTRRRNEHKSRCYDKKCKQYDVKLYQVIRDTGWSNWSMIELATVMCESKTERLQIEQEYLNLLNCKNCNTNRAYNSPEYNINWMKEYQKQWYIDNRVEINFKRRQRRLLKVSSSKLETSLHLVQEEPVQEEPVQEEPLKQVAQQ